MARRSSKIDASVRKGHARLFDTTFFADVLIQHQQDPGLRTLQISRQTRLTRRTVRIQDPRSKIFRFFFLDHRRLSLDLKSYVRKCISII